MDGIRVVIADAHHLVRAGLHAAMAREKGIRVVGEAATTTATLQAVRQLRPSVVIIDADLPGKGLDVLLRDIIANKTTSRTSCLVLGRTDNHDKMIESIRAGALGWLTKDHLPTDLVFATRMVAGGHLMVNPSLAQLVMTRLATGAVVSPAPRLAGLTPRQLEVLRLVGAGLTNPEIAARLSVQESTVKSHVHHIMQKLSLRDRAAAVVLAHYSGLMDRRLSVHRWMTDPSSAA